MALFWILKQINIVSSVQYNTASPRGAGEAGQWWLVVASGCSDTLIHARVCPLIVRPLLLLMPPFQSKMLGWNSVIQPDYTQNVIKFGITALPLFIGCLANICIFFNVV